MFKKVITILALVVLVASCRDSLPENKETTITTTLKDNHTVNNYTEIIKDNHTVTTTTTTTSSTNDTTSTSSTTSTPSSEVVNNSYIMALYGGNSQDLSIANWTLGTLPTLTLYLEGNSDLLVVNQTGVTPNLDNFTKTTGGFFNYSLVKSEMKLDGATVNSDNTSDITLLYKTKLYGFVKENLNILELNPIEFTLKVK